jgi:hypothetical protein
MFIQLLRVWSAREYDLRLDSLFELSLKLMLERIADLIRRLIISSLAPGIARQRSTNWWMSWTTPSSLKPWTR